MARVKKVKDSWHRIAVDSDRHDGEVILVIGGRNAYLWVGRYPHKEAGCITVSGTKTLRALAKAILKETHGA